jgi:hypothetical protein
MANYRFVCSIDSFEEAHDVVSCVFMELNKVSANGRLHKFSDPKQIIETLLGAVVNYGVDLFGEQEKGSEIFMAGFVESARLVGEKVVGTIQVTSKKLLDKLNKGTNLFVSVSGQGSSILKKGFTEIRNPEVTHVQIWESTQKNPLSKPQAGFESAKNEKNSEIDESVLFTGSTTAATLTDPSRQNLPEQEPNNESRAWSGWKEEYKR